MAKLEVFKFRTVGISQMNLPNEFLNVFCGVNPMFEWDTN